MMEHDVRSYGNSYGKFDGTWWESVKKPRRKGSHMICTAFSTMFYLKS